MRDDRLKTLQRRALETRDIADEVAYLGALMRMGPTSKHDIGAGLAIVDQAISSCHDARREGVAEETIDRVVYLDAGCNCGSLSGGGDVCRGICDTWSWCILALKDGRFVFAHESSDTSGHG